ncbi:SHOCT domain-containing protein [Acetanaerobacterium elongatum]|uniref:SHOCT-like domain-containing protein n=1 Tax=Acetanaerobacterium elongatum TaxID=258515 RepID=A0A1H0EB63_9FIRM|nr:SHOCT domain-containing protein [Acetanaerobacterium elongatum]SDN79581.1 hypothetical protein SAMN05192585_13238 [Acetanaerobacterium elongatum]
MKKEQFYKEMLYHSSLSPFKAMLKNGIISGDDYRVIDTILRVKYSPLFVEKSYQIPLDNK